MLVLVCLMELLAQSLILSTEIVQFDNYSGPPFIEETPQMFPIVPVERKIDCNCCGCRRQQIPLRFG